MKRVPSTTLRLTLAAAGLVALAAAQGATALAVGQAQAVAVPLALLPLAGVGVVVAARQPHNRLAWLMLAFVGLTLVLYIANGVVELNKGRLTSPAAVAAGVAGDVAFSLFASSAAWLLLLFPDGGLPSRRWRWLVWVYGVTLVALLAPTESETSYGTRAPLVIPALQGLGDLFGPVWAVGVALMLVAGPVAVAVRWRRSRGAERQQFKVVGWTVGVLTVAGVAVRLVNSELLFILWMFAGVVGLPLAIGVAILRYRLYGIDRLISRTVSYTLVTAILALPYLLVVPAITRIVSSDLAVAVATLAAAAAFNPLRRRVQSGVDRRFNRARYDAARTVDAFSSRLRDELDLDELRADLLAIVHRTMQPAHVSLWLRQDSP